MVHIGTLYEWRPHDWESVKVYGFHLLQYRLLAVDKVPTSRSHLNTSPYYSFSNSSLPIHLSSCFFHYANESNQTSGGNDIGDILVIREEIAKFAMYRITVLLEKKIYFDSVLKLLSVYLSWGFLTHRLHYDCILLLMTLESELSRKNECFEVLA